MTILGIDVGNYDTKSQNTTIPSGYEGPYNTKPAISNQYLLFAGEYYVPTVNRLYFMKDKTSDERAIVLTLMSIATELIDKFSKKEGATRESIQAAITGTTHISLGAGLPISHYTKTYIDNLINYYHKYMGSGIEFEYCGYSFNLIMDVCRIYPQGGAAFACKANRFMGVFSTYYLIDIGGYTVDVAQFKDDSISKDKLSLDLGIIIMYDSIIDKATVDFDVDLDYGLIEAVLNDKKTILKAEVNEMIKAMTQKHADNIVYTLRQKKILLNSHPCLFIGGGSLLLKQYLLNNNMVSTSKDETQFITDTRANAKGYTRLLKAECKS